MEIDQQPAQNQDNENGDQLNEQQMQDDEELKQQYQEVI